MEDHPEELTRRERECLHRSSGRDGAFYPGEQFVSALRRLRGEAGLSLARKVRPSPGPTPTCSASGSVRSARGRRGWSLAGRSWTPPEDERLNVQGAAACLDHLIQRNHRASSDY